MIRIGNMKFEIVMAVTEDCHGSDSEDCHGSD
jgi:hypothetical protein